VKTGIARLLRKYLIAGLLFWVPAGLTWLTFKFLLDLTDGLLTLLPDHLKPDNLLGFHVPGFGVLVALVALLLTGLLVRNLVGQTLVTWWEDLMNRIPLVRTLYSGLKGFTESLMTSKASFRQVVMIEFPRRESWTIAFVTATNMPDLSGRNGGEPMVCVYVPTTPLPTTGYTLIVRQSEVVPIDMSVDDAMKMIVTLGVVVPPGVRPELAPDA
jgi:PGF-CTERM protein